MPNLAEAYGPYTQYLQGLAGYPTQGYVSPGWQYQANMYNPIRSLWEMRQPIVTAAGQETQPWEEYMTGHTGMGSVYGEAGNVYNTLMGLTPQARQTWGLNYEPTYDPSTGEQQWEGKNLGDLQDLMTLGLRNRFGGVGSQWAASRLPNMMQQWQLGQAQQQPETSFLDYIKSKYGL